MNRENHMAKGPWNIVKTVISKANSKMDVLQKVNSPTTMVIHIKAR
jgi:hypothetical protein